MLHLTAGPTVRPRDPKVWEAGLCCASTQACRFLAGGRGEWAVMELLLVQLLAETWCMSTKLADADFVAFLIKGHRSSVLKQH